MSASKILMPQLVSMLSASSGMPKKQVETFFKAFFATISDSLAEHETVKIKGLGTFKVTRIEARKSVNVSTGSDVQIPAHYRVVFTPSKSMAEKVNREFSWLDVVEVYDEVTNEELDSVPVAAAVVSDNEETREEKILPVDPIPEIVVDETPDEPLIEASAYSFTYDIKESRESREEEEQESERLGEEIEKDFGDIEPVEPFGPIDPDDPEPGTPENISYEVAHPEENISEESVPVESVPVETVPERIVPADVPKPIAPEEISAAMMEDFDPYAPDHIEQAAVAPNEPYYLTLEEYENMATRNDLKSIAKNVKRIKNQVESIDRKSSRRSGFMLFWSVFITIILIVGSFLLVYYFFPQLLNPQQATVAATTVVATQTQADDEFSPTAVAGVGNAETVNPASAQDIIAIDKITSSRHLTTMAKEYYNNFNFWPYIYLENQDRLDHPDNIAPGTEIVIPNLAKYNIDPSNPADLEKAKKLSVEVYKKFSE